MASLVRGLGPGSGEGMVRSETGLLLGVREGMVRSPECLRSRRSWWERSDGVMAQDVGICSTLRD